jgi:hypothetical protein
MEPNSGNDQMTAGMKKSLEIAHKAERSLQRAVDRVVAEHAVTGTPLVVYKCNRTISKTSHPALVVSEKSVRYKTRKNKT